MTANRIAATYSRLRQAATWKLLAADNGTLVIALLQANLYGEERSLPASIFQERLTHNLQQINLDQERLPQPARAYIAEWLREGYLERHFPSGAAEEEYQLSSASVAAIRFASALAEPRSAGWRS